jgi:hypothetical protein
MIKKRKIAAKVSFAKKVNCIKVSAVKSGSCTPGSLLRKNKENKSRKMLVVTT